MDGRDAFLTMARERHYEFSSLRRCKYSTMSLLYELHTQGNDKFVYTCNSCNKSVETRYNISKHFLFMFGSSYIRSVLIGVKYQNYSRTLDVYLLFAI